MSQEYFKNTRLTTMQQQSTSKIEMKALVQPRVTHESRIFQQY